MNELYGANLAWVYDEIYQGFIDYKAEYQFFKRICKEYKCDRILELACGTGNLSESFTKDFKRYVGLDFSEAMLKIAKKKFPDGKFVQGDMRCLNFEKQFDAVLITGRSTSYLMNDSDLQQTFTSVQKSLTTGGIFVFDTINADLFMPFISQNEFVTHRSEIEGKKYERDSRWKKQESDRYHLIAWAAEYFRTDETNRFFLGKDETIFRVFTPQEISTILNKTGFEILKIQERETYAFATNVFVCRRLV
ncbi:class I SAM-dependent DNA methyltransferase [Maribacter sp. X9]|uniref:class I SAM-dependent DNA methyltransferase n=1 Tax=Maribacter sp. X9 TaxID=3402159 RepID=UPI003AF37DC7